MWFQITTVNKEAKYYIKSLFLLSISNKFHPALVCSGKRNTNVAIETRTIPRRHSTPLSVKHNETSEIINVHFCIDREN